MIVDDSPAISLVRKLAARVELAIDFGTEAEESPLWPMLNPPEMALLNRALDGIDP